MTGFGKADFRAKAIKITVEISSVNNRYLEITPRLPRHFFTLEPKIRELIKPQISRGKINLYVGYEEGDVTLSKYSINHEAATSYFKQLSKLKKELKIKGDITVNDLISFPELSRPDNGEIDEKKIWNVLEKVLKTAISNLVKMRQKEGQALALDMKKRVSILTNTIKKVQKLSKQSVINYRDRLNKRVLELLENSLPDNVRIEEEIALLAERSDISEECTRFKSHLDQYLSSLKEKNAVGKKLNFILQELNREANTVASKCADINIAKEVIIIKEEIEKLREQVQNIE